MAIITKYIYVDPDASGSANGTSWTDAYTSLATAVQTEATDITSTGTDERHVYYCRSSAGSADTSAVALNDLASSTWTYTTDATNYVVISVTDQHNGIWNTSMYRLSVNGGSSLTLNDNYAYVYNLQVEQTSTGGFTYAFGRSNDVLTNILWFLDGCIFKARTSSIGYGQSAFTVSPSASSAAGSVDIHNCVLIGGYRTLYVGDTDAASIIIRIFNCTLYGGSSDTIYSNTSLGSNILCINTLAWGLTDVLQSVRWGSGGETNLRYHANNNVQADDIGGTGYLPYSAYPYYDLSSYSLTDVFTDPSNFDFSLVSSSPVIDVGTDLSSSGITTDITGAVRSGTWDIGAFEYGAGTPEPSTKYTEQARIINIT
jgi:hypothetical protein